MSAPVAGEPSADITIRPLRDRAEYEACLRLQHRTWGEGFVESVAPALQMIAQKLGGVVAGAFDSRGEMVGFVLGLTGAREGRLVHWSHMLAVVPELRDRGVGRRLKEHQRRQVEALGIEEIGWTFDPLVARNAHLNLNRLGVEVEAYHVDLYGDEPGNELARGIGTDRFVVRWPVGEAAGRRRLRDAERARRRSEAAPVLNPGGRRSAAEELAARLDEPILRVEVPPDVYSLLRHRPNEAQAWRDSSRRAFVAALERGYVVAGFYRDADGACFYGLERQGGGVGR